MMARTIGYPEDAANKILQSISPAIVSGKTSTVLHQDTSSIGPLRTPTEIAPQVLDQIVARVESIYGHIIEKTTERFLDGFVMEGMTGLENRIELLEQTIDELKRQLTDLNERLLESATEEKVIVLREITKEEAREEIRNLFKRGKVLYYSEIAERLRLDLELVVEICNELMEKGEIDIAR